jgi:GTP cyclohydrolase I
MPVDYNELIEIGRRLLVAIGEDPTRQGLVETPERFAKWWREFIEYKPGETNKTFESVTTDQMVVISGLRVWSLCEHHMLPFWCDISIGYIARDKVLGLSKFARIAHKYAHSLQVQERLIHQIADEVERVTGSKDVAVIGRGEHLCMVARGIKTQGIMSSSVMRGVFLTENAARYEFLSMVKYDVSSK